MADLSYDPYDVAIDADPYPVYKRLRDEAPVYYDEKFDFWALSRFADVESTLRDVENLSSAKGDILEVVKAEPVMPLGVFINEDPPLHTVHRLLVSRAFTPRKMQAIEDQVRAFCAACLDPLTDGDRFDFTLDLGAEMPMRVIGMLVGMPDELQRSVRKVAGRRLRNKPGSRFRSARTTTSTATCSATTSSGVRTTRPTTSSPNCSTSSSRTSPEKRGS